MSRPNQARHPSGRTPLGLFAIGLGLLMVGTLVFFANPGLEPEAGAPASGSALPAAVDYPAPDLTMTALDGTKASLQAHRGQVVLVNLWATWCPPCKAEMPTLQAYYEAHQLQGFTLVAINAGEAPSEVKAFVDNIGLTFPVWLDPDNAAMRVFHTPGLPSSYVIDRSGQVRLAWMGAIESLQLEEYVTPILQE